MVSSARSPALSLYIPRYLSLSLALSRALIHLFVWLLSMCMCLFVCLLSMCMCLFIHQRMCMMMWHMCMMMWHMCMMMWHICMCLFIHQRMDSCYQSRVRVCARVYACVTLSLSFSQTRTRTRTPPLLPPPPSPFLSTPPLSPTQRLKGRGFGRKSTNNTIRQRNFVLRCTVLCRGPRLVLWSPLWSVSWIFSTPSCIR